MAITVTSGTYNLPDGTVSAPAIAFSSETGTGWFRDSSSGTLRIARSGTQLVSSFNSTGPNVLWVGSMQPITDNTLSFGANGERFHFIYSVNGTLQTSHSDYKREIQDLPLTLEVPRGINFYWKDGAENKRLQIGYLADNLPKDAFELDKDDNIIKTGVYDSAVIGILCSHVRDLQKRIVTLKTELLELQKL